MNVRLGPTVPLCLLFAGLCFTPAVTTAAQGQAGNVTPPPKVLEVIVEYVKPGQAGSPHEKTEGTFAQAMRDAKESTPYLGMNALTGRSRAVFFVPYDSFADWQKDTDAQMKNTGLFQQLDNATIADGELLSDTQTSIYHWRDDLSLRPGADVGHLRYFEVLVFRIRSGHEKDFETAAKMYIDAYQKIPDAHWDMFEKMYGVDSGNTFILVQPMKSLAEVDEGMANDKKLKDAVGADQLQKMQALADLAIESSESNLLAINPKMSYATDTWTKEDPDFWTPKQ